MSSDKPTRPRRIRLRPSEQRAEGQEGHRRVERMAAREARRIHLDEMDDDVGPSAGEEQFEQGAGQGAADYRRGEEEGGRRLAGGHEIADRDDGQQRQHRGADRADALS